MKRYLLLIPIIVLAIALGVATSGSVFSKGHVPLGDVQVCHKGRVAKNMNTSSMIGHQAHGDIQLPACDGTVVFGDGADCSGVTDLDNDGKADLAAPNPVTSPACPAGTF